MSIVKAANHHIVFPRTFLRRRSHIQRDINTLLGEIRAQAQFGLHLGAGGTRIPGLINCDLFDPRADRKLDATNLAGIDGGSVDLIEHHHMIEHLSLEQADHALREWARVLQPGGLLVFTCPDLVRVCWLYIRTRIVDAIRPRADQLEYQVKMFVGSQEHEGMFHKSHYDAQRVRRLLQPRGFTVEFTHPYPPRPTPSLLTIARRVPHQTE
jgi:predicted SAM-dependent methyltransferase